MERFPAPIGAIWICGTTESHHLEVKVNVTSMDGKEIRIREKHIAIPNRKKTRPSQPDYFLHVYQPYTGASPVPPFQARRSKETTRGSEGMEQTVKKEDAV